MTLNKNVADGYQLRFDVTASGLAHRVTMLLNVVGSPVPGTSFASIDLVGRDATSWTLLNWLVALWADMAPLYETGVTFGNAELWFAPNDSTDYTFIASSSASSGGSSGTAPNLSHQLTLTFRSGAGSYAKLVLLETSSNAQNSIPISASTPSIITLSDRMCGVDTPVLARDNGVLIAPMKVSGGQNEKIFRIRNR